MFCYFKQKYGAMFLSFLLLLSVIKQSYFCFESVLNESRQNETEEYVAVPEFIFAVSFFIHQLP